MDFMSILFFYLYFRETFPNIIKKLKYFLFFFKKILKLQFLYINFIQILQTS